MKKRAKRDELGCIPIRSHHGVEFGILGLRTEGFLETMIRSSTS